MRGCRLAACRSSLTTRFRVRLLEIPFHVIVIKLVCNLKRAELYENVQTTLKSTKLSPFILAKPVKRIADDDGILKSRIVDVENIYL